MYVVIRLRGSIGINRAVGDTLTMMRLKSVNNCVILPETPDVKGMLRKTKDYITWGEISKETLAKLLEKRLRTKENEKRVDAKLLKESTGFDSFENFASAIIEGKIKLHKQENLQATFRLTPPSKGFKSITEHYPRGDLGHRGKEINELIGSMI